MLGVARAGSRANGGAFGELSEQMVGLWTDDIAEKGERIEAMRLTDVAGRPPAGNSPRNAGSNRVGQLIRSQYRDGHALPKKNL